MPNSIDTSALQFDRNYEGKKRFFFNCKDCGCRIRYLKFRLKTASFRCRKCASRRKPPPVQKKTEYHAIYRMHLWACAKRGKPNNLTFEQFTEFTKTSECHYCGSEVKWERWSSSIRKWSTAVNLDRKNNELGYSTENCVVCCKECNMTKSDRFTFEEFELMAPVIRQIMNRRKNSQNDQS